MSLPSMIRTRWAALGAAVAVTLGASGVSLLHASAPSGGTAFVPITPCRLVDTRPTSPVGPRTNPLGPDEEYDVAAVGAQGNCNLPVAAGLSLNVTAVGASHDTFLTFFPDGATRPTASHLNPAADAKPAPNAVTVDLSDGGAFTAFNRFGTVHLVVDVVGYYTGGVVDVAALGGQVAELLTVETTSASQQVPEFANLPSVTAQCPPGSHAIAGSWGATGPTDFHVRTSWTTADGTGWNVRFVSDDQAAPGPGNTITVSAVCSVLPVHTPVEVSVAVDPTAPTASASAPCPAGSHPVGGGVEGRGSSASWLVIDSYADGASWVVELEAETLTFNPSLDPPNSVTAYAMCSSASV